MLPKAFLGGQTRTVLLFRRSLQTTLTARSGASGDYWDGPEKAAGREVSRKGIVNHLHIFTIYQNI